MIPIENVNLNQQRTRNVAISDQVDIRQSLSLQASDHLAVLEVTPSRQRQEVIWPGIEAAVFIESVRIVLEEENAPDVGLLDAFAGGLSDHTIITKQSPGSRERMVD
ncbi:MAG: hypothetical protein K0M67_17125 [Thiobacillus sp.]|nr:hypothetical protein [Thiobacillus sp.]